MKIDIAKLTFDGQRKLYELDEKFIGTANYMGIAFFWNYNYRFDLRDATPTERKRVHLAFIKAGLKVNQSSDAHLSIINKTIK